MIFKDSKTKPDYGSGREVRVRLVGGKARGRCLHQVGLGFVRLLIERRPVGRYSAAGVKEQEKIDVR